MTSCLVGTRSFPVWGPSRRRSSATYMPSSSRLLRLSGRPRSACTSLSKRYWTPTQTQLNWCSSASRYSTCACQSTKIWEWGQNPAITSLARTTRICLLIARCVGPTLCRWVKSVTKRTWLTLRVLLTLDLLKLWYLLTCLEKVAASLTPN